METVSLKIDGRDITVAKGKTILEAALDNGISIPFYCYHPGIGVEGSCRVCIVKVEKMPKLQTSCSTVCTDGMVVATGSPEVVQARASVFEFLLINHPLDCPVCDKGGECPLQDYSYTFGPAGSRMEFPRRTFDGEGVSADVDFGPTLMLNRNRCIMCTRCVRFMKEIDADAQIGVVDRGGHSQIATFGERGVHSLLSGNLMDVCPVGAITTRDYRFKSRPWDNPLAVDTTCTLCSKGCSTTAWLKAKPEWAKGARLIRFTPRYNPDVNGYWMCDIGRFQYHWVEGDARLTTPLLRQASGAQAKSTWGGALATVRERLLPVAKEQAAGFRMLVSAHASHEELYLVRQFVTQIPGASLESTVAVSWRSSAKVQPRGTRFTVPPVDAPNAAGARAMGFRVPEGDGAACDVSGLRTDVESGAVKALYVDRPRARGQHRRRAVGDRRARRRPAAAADCPGRRDVFARGRRRHRPARRGVGGEGSDLYERSGAAAGHRPRDGAAGRRARGLARAGRCGHRGRHHDELRGRAGRARRHRRGLGRRAGARGHHRRGVPEADGGKDLAAGLEPFGALEVGPYVPGSRAGERVSAPA